MKTSSVTEPGRKELREFGFITGSIVAVLFGLLLPWLFGHGFPLWPFIVAAVLWLWATVLPSSLLPVYKGWMAVGHVLGWINTRIILGIMFYLMFLPVGVVMKIFGKDPMARSIDKTSQTYRVVRTGPDKDHVERPY